MKNYIVFALIGALILVVVLVVVLVVLPKSSSSSLTSAPTTSAPTTSAALVKTVSLEKPMGGPDYHMNLAEIELYDAQNIKIPVSNLTASLSPPYTTSAWGAASNLLDGSPDTFAATNQVDTSATLQYMRVVLTNPSSIGRVVVTSRTYCCKARINGVSVRTMDINNAELSKTVLSGSGGTYSLTYNPISGSNIGVINTPALTNAP